MKTVVRMACCVALASLFAAPAHALTVTDQVKINEVSYDPSESTGPPNNAEGPWEYIELYNAGATTAFLDGAVISDEGTVGTAEATFKFPGSPGGTTIPLASHAYMLLVADATGSPFNALANFEFFGGGSDTDDPAVPNLTKTDGSATNLLLGNTGDGVTLSIGTTTTSAIPCSEVVDGMSYELAGAPDITAMSNTVCTDPAPNPGYANGGPTTLQTLQRCPNGADTNNSTTDFSATDRTPKAANGCNSIPPVITNLHYAPCYVTANLPVNVSCSVTDDNNDITLVRLYYKLSTSASFDSLTMAFSVPDVYSATVPGQADQAEVQYYMIARDATGNTVKSPSTAPAFLRSYRVGIQTLASLQVPTVNDSCAASSQLNRAVNVSGVVTHKKLEYSDNFFYIQNGIGPNSGIKIFGSDSTFVPEFGDSVLVSGFIDEFHCQTEVSMFTNCATIVSHNRKVRVRQLANVSDINLEVNESMLVTVQGPITVATANDSTNLGKEFKIGSGTNIAYVGDDTFFPDGIGYTVIPAPGMILDAVTGIVGYRRVDTTVPRADQSLILRLEPRRDNDVDRDYTDVGDGDQLDVVRAFHLNQNRPNPFNPVTTIEFAVPKAGPVALRIYDAKGEVVRTLLGREYAGPAHDRVVWDGRNDAGKTVPSGVYFYKLEAGDASATRKMLLLK